MSYTSERAGTAGSIINNSTIMGDEFSDTFQKLPMGKFYKYLTNEDPEPTTGVGTYNLGIKLKDGSIYKLKNSETLKNNYNLCDVIASALDSGYTTSEIASALTKANITNPYPKTGMQTERGLNTWTPEDVQQFNTNSTSIGQQLQKYYGPNAKITTLLDKNGVDYSYKVSFKDAKGVERAVDITPDSIKNARKDSSGNILPEYLPDILSKAGVPTSDELTNIVNTTANAQAQINAGTQILQALGYDKDGNPINPVGTNAQTNKTLSASDIDSVQAKAPDTAGLTAWNKYNDSNVSNIVGNNLQGPNSTPSLLERASLAELQGYADTLNDENLNTTLRNTNLQQRILLNNIKNDPELYSNIINQLRNDAAAGISYGQRAANAGEQAKASDATYDESAQKLYDSLFGGDQTQAAAIRESILNNRGSALDSYLGGAIDNLMMGVRERGNTVTDLSTAAEALKTALGVDQSRYDNRALLEGAKADSRLQDLIGKLQSDSQINLADQDSLLSLIGDSYGLAKNYLQGSANGSADVSATINTILDYLKSPTSVNSNYTNVSTPEAKKLKDFYNTQYYDVVNNPNYAQFLTDDAINSLTGKYEGPNGVQEFINDSELAGIFSKDNIANLYKQYVDEANTSSDKVFNAAQRAYIAAIAAGDSKTTEQLVKLAQTANVNKGNLYAASALSNMYNQQRNSNNIGLNISNDFLNQQSANNTAVANAANAANNTYNSYLGNGSDSYDKGTVYGAFNMFKDQNATARNIYGNFGNTIMNTTQGFNNTNAQLTADNQQRLGNAAGAFTTVNATGAANNIKNARTSKTYAADALAAIAQGDTTLKNLNK